MSESLWSGAGEEHVAGSTTIAVSNWARPHAVGAGTSGAPRARHLRRMQRVLDYLETHLVRDLRVAELANVAGASPSHFKVLFKQSVGMPVHHYVVRRRVERALRLLATTDLPLCDIALQAGFANQSHMARWVRRLAGASPRALRQAI